MQKNAFCFFSSFNCGQASPEVVPTPARPPWCRGHPQPGAARCSEPLCLSSTRLPVAPFHSWTEELGPLLRALLLCGSEAAAVSVAQWWLGELQDGGSGFVEELGGTAQQSLGLSEGARQLLQPLCKLGVTLHRETCRHWDLSTHLQQYLQKCLEPERGHILPVSPEALLLPSGPLERGVKLSQFWALPIHPLYPIYCLNLVGDFLWVLKPQPIE